MGRVIWGSEVGNLDRYYDTVLMVSSDLLSGYARNLVF